MKKLSFICLFLVGLLTSSAAMSQSMTAAGSAGGHCGCKLCDCLDNYGKCMWAISSSYSGANSEMPAIFSIADDNTILISYQHPLPDPAEGHDETISFTSGIALPADICAQLGAASITLTPGSYTPDYSENPNGNLSINATIITK